MKRIHKESEQDRNAWIIGGRKEGVGGRKLRRDLEKQMVAR